MVNYPNGKQYCENKNINYGKRGMSLEDDLNSTNAYYLENDIAAIYKKPTPITICTVDYKSRQSAKITEAYFQVPSTTDYNGVYKGYYIDFEAKETHNKTSLPLEMIHQHQIKHIEKVIRYGGKAFLIVRFVNYNETFFVKASLFLNYINNTTRKSIPYKWFKENCPIIEYSYLVKVNYLKIFDQLIAEDF